MKTASAKAKGRKAANEVRTQILNVFSELSADDVHTISSGVTGEDLKLSPRARSLVPFVFEVKNQEKISIWEAIAQAKSHCKDGDQWCLAFKRNRSELLAVVPMNDLLHLLRRIADK